MSINKLKSKEAVKTTKLSITQPQEFNFATNRRVKRRSLSQGNESNPVEFTKMLRSGKTTVSVKIFFIYIL